MKEQTSDQGTSLDFQFFRQQISACRLRRDLHGLCQIALSFPLGSQQPIDEDFDIQVQTAGMLLLYYRNFCIENSDFLMRTK